MAAAITRRERTGHIAAADAVTALADFAHDFVHQYFLVELSAGLISHAAALAARHALRGYDAMQLAGAFEVQTNIPALVPVSADADLNTPAAAEGLPVENPNSHPSPAGEAATTGRWRTVSRRVILFARRGKGSMSAKGFSRIFSAPDPFLPLSPFPRAPFVAFSASVRNNQKANFEF